MSAYFQACISIAVCFIAGYEVGVGNYFAGFLTFVIGIILMP